MKASLTLFVFVVTCLSCSKEQGKTAEKLTVKVAEDVCKEVAQEAGISQEELVSLLCKVGADEIGVLLPKAQWRAMQTKKLDAGPGI